MLFHRRATITSRGDVEVGLAPRVVVMRIIVIALMAGVGSFFVIAVFLRSQVVMPNAAPAPIITYVGFAYAVGVLVAYSIVPNRVVVATRRQLAMNGADSIGPADSSSLSPDLGALLAAYQTRLLIGAALIEGIAFYFLIAYLIDGLWGSLVVVGFCLAALAGKFPTESGVRRWLESQQELLQYERSQR